MQACFFFFLLAVESFNYYLKAPRGAPPMEDEYTSEGVELSPGQGGSSAYSSAPLPSPGATPTTIITASGVVVSGGAAAAGDSGRLAARVQVQARELADMSGALGRSEAYARLLERRLLEVVPEHPLPVSEAALGTHVGRLSKLALAAAQTLTGVSSPGKVAGVAPYVLAQNAANRTQTRDQAETIKLLERNMDAKRRQLDDAVARIKELRGALETKEKERIAALRRAEGMQQRLISTEAEMRMAGLAHGAPGSGSSGSGSLGSSLRDSHAASAAATAGGSVSEAHLLARLDVLQGELRAVGRARDAAQEALARESRACSDSRAQAEALEAQFKDQLKRLLGGGAASGAAAEDTATLYTRVAKLQGEVEARARDGAAKDAALAELRARLREAEEAARVATAAATGTGIALAASGASASGGTPSRGSAAAAAAAASAAAQQQEIVLRSPHLGNISLRSHAPPPPPGAAASPGAPPPPPSPSATLARLEAEKGALLDYIAETRDAVAALSGQLSEAARARPGAEAALARAAGD